VVATFLQLHHRFAFIAALPTFFSGLTKEFGCSLVLGARSRSMRLEATSNAHLVLAAPTASNLLAIFLLDSLGFDPLTALPRWAI
jgi:hypothetical protein